MMTNEQRDALVEVFYEKCANGEISRAQRELLIQKANSQFIATEACVKAEAADDDKCDKKSDKKLTPKEKYDKVKEALYEKHSKKEITEEQREALLEMARDKFLDDDEDIDDEEDEEDDD